MRLVACNSGSVIPSLLQEEEEEEEIDEEELEDYEEPRKKRPRSEFIHEEAGDISVMMVLWRV